MKPGKNTKIILITFFAAFCSLHRVSCADQINDLLTTLKNNLRAEQHLSITTEFTVRIDGFEYKGIKFNGIKSLTQFQINKNIDKNIVKITDSKEIDFWAPPEHSMALLLSLVKKEENTFYISGEDLFFPAGKQWFKITLSSQIWNSLQSSKEETIQTNNTLSRSMVKILKGFLGTQIFEQKSYLEKLNLQREETEQHVILKGTCPENIKNKAKKLIKKIPLKEKAGKDLQIDQAHFEITIAKKEILPLEITATLEAQVTTEDNENISIAIYLKQDYNYSPQTQISLPLEAENAQDLTHKSDEEIRKIFTP